jgi:hypothetical protein
VPRVIWVILDAVEDALTIILRAGPRIFSTTGGRKILLEKTSQKTPSSFPTPIHSYNLRSLRRPSSSQTSARNGDHRRRAADGNGREGSAHARSPGQFLQHRPRGRRPCSRVPGAALPGRLLRLATRIHQLCLLQPRCLHGRPGSSTCSLLPPYVVHQIQLSVSRADLINAHALDWLLTSMISLQCLLIARLWL